jgi:hypothetical protein
MWPRQPPCAKSGFYLVVREKAESVNKPAKEECDYPEKLKFIARKPPEGNSGNHPGESSKPFTLFTPGWQPAVHDPFPNPSNPLGSLAE